MGKVVFIVDDDSDDREFFCEALHEIDANITCVCAGNGNEAIEMLNQPHTVLPDYIFMDLNMPRLSGKQCLALIKKMERYSNVPVIIFSTTRQFHEAEETKKLGATLFLTKPSSYTELKKNLSLILSQAWNKIDTE